MLKAIFKWPFAIWLICAFILVASFDRLPDPPAVKPHGRMAKVLNVSGHHERCFDKDRDWSLSVRPPESRFDFETVLEAEHLIHLSRLMLQASDSSPPAFAS